MADGRIEDSPFAVAANPTHRNVVIRAIADVAIRFLVHVRLLRIEAEQNVQLVAVIRRSCETKELILPLKLFPCEGGGQRARGIVDLDNGLFVKVTMGAGSGAQHVAEFGPVDRSVRRAMVCRQPAAFADESHQAFADFRIGENLAHRVVQKYRVEFLDLRVSEIIEIVVRDHRVRARFLPQSSTAMLAAGMEPCPG